MDRNGNERGAGANMDAAGIAFDALRADTEAAADAREFLREQARLARLQADQIAEEGALVQRVKRASEVMKFAFELSVALVLVVVAVALAGAMWSAARDNGLVIEAFSVPPDLAARGLSGEVVANQLLDKLARMQAETNSIRPADTYRNNWGDDIKVEIPDTGISIGELNRYLVHWLGHETHISGEIYRTPGGIAVTARANEAGETFTGRETDLDALLQKAAEAIYSETQPYRYAAFLNEQNRNQEAVLALKKLAAEASPAERAWALSLLGNLYTFFNRPADSVATLKEAVAADPSNAHAWDNLASGEQSLGHLANGYRFTAEALRLYDNGSVAFNPERVAIVKLQDRSFLLSALGDYQGAIAADREIENRPDRGNSQLKAQIDELGQAASNHDFLRAHALRAAIHPSDDNTRINLWFQLASLAYFEHDWDSLAHLFEPKTIYAAAPSSFRPVLRFILSRTPNALLADAKAETGDIAGARALIATTPLDCYDCVRLRGRIDAAAKNWNGAAYWFSRAVNEGDFIPAAWTDWGAMLLEKGDLPGAVTKFEAAAQRGPHYADPREMWGEALMRENRSDLALEKFADAGRYAPNWGRLHLMWGEALWYVGRKREARAQWALADALALSRSDRAALASRMHKT